MDAKKEILRYPTVALLSVSDKKKKNKKNTDSITALLEPGCFICGKRINDAVICPYCHFDRSMNYEEYRSLTRIRKEQISSVRQREQYHNWEIQIYTRETQKFKDQSERLSRKVKELEAEILQLKKEKATSKKEGYTSHTYSQRDSRIGTVMKFGTYIQKRNGEKSPIEWVVLDVRDGKALLLSVYGLDMIPYHNKKNEICWDKSSIRGWLNGEFYNRAFSDSEKTRIVESIVSSSKNPCHTVEAGTDTKDRIYLLSIDEYNRYFDTDEDRICRQTDYAASKNAMMRDRTKNCWWWLRSPGYYNSYAAIGDINGKVDLHGENVRSRYIAVRPAMWIVL